MRTIVYISAFLFIGELAAQITFNNRLDFGLPTISKLSGVIPTDSCYYTMGLIIDDEVFQYANVFIKFDLEGNPLLMKKYADAAKWLYTYEPAFVQTYDNFFAAAGTMLDSIRRLFLLKYDENGDTLFLKTYLHPSYPAEDFVYLYDLLATDDGGFLMIGNMEDANLPGDTDILLIKTDSLGNEQWKRHYGTSINEFGICVARSKTGNGYVIGANRNNTNTNVEDYIYRAYVFEVDSLGNVLWQYLSPPDTLRDWAHDIALHADGSITVASGVCVEIPLPSLNFIHCDRALFKLNPAHEMEWERVFHNYPMSASVSTYKLVNLSDGSGVVLAGKSYDEYTQSSANPGWIAKISPNGDSLWAREYQYVDEKISEHTIFDMKETSDGGLIICGGADDYSGNDPIIKQAWLLKLDEHGCLIPGCHLIDAVEEEAVPEIGLAIYPNPTTDFLNFQLKGHQPPPNASFRIVDANGRAVSGFSGSAANTTFIVPVWDWPAGVYILQYLECGVVRCTERFVKG